MISQPEAYEGKAPYIFISYAHKNSDAVLPAIRALEDAGYPVWYDGGIQVGSEWPEYIAEHLLHSSLVIAFISEASIASQNCRQEIVYALDKHKPMITVHLEEVHLPPGMEMQLNLCQALLAYKHVSQEGYIRELVRAPYIAETLGMKKREESARPAPSSIPTPPPTSSAPRSQQRPVTPPPSSGAQTKKSVADGLDKIKKFFDGKDEHCRYTGEDAEKNKLVSILSYFGLLVLVPLLTAKDSPYARFHANQGLLLTLFWIVVGFASVLLTLLTGGIFAIILPVIHIGLLVVWGYMIYNAAHLRVKELPFIGHFRILK